MEGLIARRYRLKGELQRGHLSHVFLAADDAGFITGSTLTINGGQYLH